MSWDDDDDDDWDGYYRPKRKKYRRSNSWKPPKRNNSPFRYSNIDDDDGFDDIFDSFKSGFQSYSSFNRRIKGHYDDIEDLEDDIDEIEDREDFADIMDDIREIKRDIQDDWFDAWEDDWANLFDISWDDSFWISRGKHLPLRVSCSPEIKGIAGEMVVAGKLSVLYRQYFHVFNDVLLEIGNTSCQIDHIVVSIFGIFVIETKNYGGTIFGHENDNKWTQIIADKKYMFYSPIKQNERHIEVLRRCLGCPKEYFKPMVVFSRNCDLKITTNTPVLFADTILQHIDRFNYPLIEESEFGNIEKKLIDSWNPSYEARLRHKRRYKKHE